MDYTQPLWLTSSLNAICDIDELILAYPCVNDVIMKGLNTTNVQIRQRTILDTRRLTTRELYLITICENVILNEKSIFSLYNKNGIYYVIYPCLIPLALSYILGMRHVSVCRSSIIPGYIGSYMTDNISQLLGCSFYTTCLGVWLIKQVLQFTRDSHFISSTPSLQLLIEDTDLSMLTSNDINDCILMLSSEPTINFSIDQRDVKLLLSLCYYLSKCSYGNPISAPWFIEKYRGDNIEHLKDLMLDPLFELLSYIEYIYK